MKVFRGKRAYVSTYFQMIFKRLYAYKYTEIENVNTGDLAKVYKVFALFCDASLSLKLCYKFKFF